MDFAVVEVDDGDDRLMIGSPTETETLTSGGELDDEDIVVMVVDVGVEVLVAMQVLLAGSGFKVHGW